MKDILVISLLLLFIFYCCAEIKNPSKCGNDPVSCNAESKYEIAPLIDTADGIECRLGDPDSLRIIRTTEDFEKLIYCIESDTCCGVGMKLPEVDFCKKTVIAGYAYLPSLGANIYPGGFSPVCPYFQLRVIIQETGQGLQVEGSAPFVFITAVLPDSLGLYIIYEWRGKDGAFKWSDTAFVKEYR